MVVVEAGLYWCFVLGLVERCSSRCSKPYAGPLLVIVVFRAGSCRAGHFSFGVSRVCAEFVLRCSHPARRMPALFVAFAACRMLLELYSARTLTVLFSSLSIMHPTRVCSQ